VKFLFHFPETSGLDADMFEPGHPVEVARHAEQVGLDGIGLTEHPVPSARWLASGGHQSLDPFVALGAIGAATSRIRLVTNLSVAPYYNPFKLAKAAATVDLMSNGRMTLGLGAGYMKSEFHALGVEFDERNALFDEVLAALPLHWSGEPFDFEGRHFNARGVIARPRPVQQPIPIWIGGNSKAAMRRAATVAQGWMPMLGPAELAATARTRHIETTDQLAEAIGEVKQAALDAGRTDTLDFMVSYTDASFVADVAVEAQRHREAFEAYEKAGITWLVVTTFTRNLNDTKRWLDSFGETYLR